MPKIAFALLSSRENPAPSTRIACLNLFPLLAEAGLEPVVLFGPDVPNDSPDLGDFVERTIEIGAAVAVFQKIRGPSVLAAMTALRKAGVGTVYCVCDFVDDTMAAAADATIVVTDFLKSLYRVDLHDKIHVVHDGIENPHILAARFEQPGVPRQGSSHRAGFVTSHNVYCIPVIEVPPRGWTVEVIGQFPADTSLAKQMQTVRWAVSSAGRLQEKASIIRCFMHPRIKHRAWDRSGVYATLSNCDVGIIPVDTSASLGTHAPAPAWKVKSENRLTLMMAIGLPVIATPIPSYEAVIQHGVNGFFATTAKEWLKCFELLRDATLRNVVGMAARKSVIERFSIERQAELFMAVVQGLIHRRSI